MHRWFFATDEIFCKSPTPPPSISQSQTSASSSSLTVADTNWLFKVKFDGQLCPNEFLAISGSCPSLGNWNVQSSLRLKDDKSTLCWSLTVALPPNCDINYRYFVCALSQRDRKIVRFWETHFSGRHIKLDQSQIINSNEYEIFGLLNNEVKIERGWLKPCTTLIQFKFIQDSFAFDLSGHKILLHIKITAIKLQTSGKCYKPCVKPGSTETCNYLNEDKKQPGETFAYCEVASVQDQKGKFHKQPKYGLPCGRDQLLIFHLTVNVLEECAFLVDLYNFPRKFASDMPPHHFGYQYILNQQLANSQGTLELKIMCGTRHRAIGNLKCDYLVVKPLKPLHNFTLETSYQRYWNAKHQGLYCGHKGCGRSFWLQNNILRENCLKSFNLAIEHGADMLDFNVQLTKDLVAIIHQDAYLYVTQNFDINLRENDIIHLPLTQQETNALKCSEIKIDKDLVMLPLSKFTQKQLGRIKVYEPPQAVNHKVATTACSSNTKNNLPFLTLQQAFQEINVKTGFVIEISWPQYFAHDDKRFFLATDFNKNDYVDMFLCAVLKNAGSRRIIFSSRDTDICTMVRLKQNLYPIMFLHQANDNQINTGHKSIVTAINFVHAMEFWGICLNYEDILKISRNISDLHEKGLRVFSWGLATRNEDERKYLKALGVDGIICERLNHVLKPLDLNKKFVYIAPWKSRT